MMEVPCSRLCHQILNM